MLTAARVLRDGKNPQAYRALAPVLFPSSHQAPTMIDKAVVGKFVCRSQLNPAPDHLCRTAYVAAQVLGPSMYCTIRRKL